MNILITVGCFWLSFFIIMKYLEIKYPDSVYSFLDRIEVTISIFYIKWRTTKLNSFFHSVGSRGNKMIRVWFMMGVVFGVIGMVASVLLLVCNLFFVVFLWKKESQQVNGVLTPVIPGVNVPTSHLGYYVFALLVAGILHEFGHAFAAVSEKCRINGFGMFLMGVYPGAFVDIGDGLHRLSPLSQLKIYCGGSWHNAVIAAGCGIILFLLPYLVLPLYVYGAEGPYVMNVHKDSIFASRVLPGDTITGIGDCSTKTSRDYENCILESFSLLGNHSIGYCLMSGYLADYGTETFECFDSEYDGPLQGFVADNTENEHYCLIASEVMQAPVCRSNDEETAYGNCQCVFPRLAPNVALLQLHVKTKKGNENINNNNNNNNNERITNNKYYNKKYNNNEKHITFVGTPQELWYSFTVRDYIFRFESLSFLDIDIPAIIDKSLRYLASISAALAMLNMAPVYFLDGEWCLRPFILLLESFLGLSLLSRRSLSSSISSSSSIPSSSPSFPNSPPLSASVLSPSLPSYSPSSLSSPSSPSSPFHFIGNMEATAVSFNSLTNNYTNNYHGIQMDSDKEGQDKRDTHRHEKEKEKERDKDTETKEKANEDPLVKNILRVVSVLFVINIGLSFINLAWT